MSALIADILQRLVAVGNHRRALIGTHRRHHVNPVRNFDGIGNHHFLCLLAPEIGKFLQHFLRGPKIKRRLIIRIRESLASHDDPAVYLVPGV